MDLSRAAVLAVINRAIELAELSNEDDEAAVLRAGLMPKVVLTRFFNTYPERIVTQLIEDGYIRESPLYLIPNPKKRTRPIVTRYDIEKPRPSSGRRPITYRVFGKDRLLLWYAAANEDFSGSRGESYGLWLVLRFLRTDPKALRRFRLFLQRPRFRIPKDAL